MSELSIHEKIADDIKQQIELGIYRKHFLLPSENTIASNYNVSRVTVQKALRILTNENYIYSIPGKGNFVKESSVDKYILKFNELNIYDKDQKQKLIGVEIENPSPELIYTLHVHPSKKVIHIKRLISIEDEPIAVDSKYIPYKSGVPIIEVEINYSAFPSLLSNVVSPYEIKRKLNIYGGSVREDIATYLELQEGAPCVIIEQMILDTEKIPIGWGRMYLNPHYFKIESLRK